MAYSTNGTSWTGLGKRTFTTTCTAVAWNGYIWVAGGSGGNQMAYSYDGLTWYPNTYANALMTTQTFGFGTRRVTPLVVSTPPMRINQPITDSFTVAGGTGNNNRLMYTFDGVTWYGVPYIQQWFSSVTSICFSGQLWVAGGTATTTGGPCLIYSYDGIVWNPCNFNSSWMGSSNSTINSIATNGYIWIASNSTANSNSYSRDGINWVQGDNPGGNNPSYGVCWTGTMWIAAVSSGCYITYSYDGLFFRGGVINPAYGSIFSEGRCAASNGIVHLVGGQAAVPAGGTMAYSYNGMQWVPLGTLIFSTMCYAIAWNGQLWVAGGTGTNTLAYSYDGIAWIPSISGNNQMTSQCNAVTWNGTYWFACGSGTNRMLYSVDGINWFPHASGNALGGATTINAIASRAILPIQAPVVNGGPQQSLTQTYSMNVQPNQSIQTSSALQFQGRNGPGSIGPESMIFALGTGTGFIARSYDGKNWGSTTSGSIGLTTIYAGASNGTVILLGGTGTSFSVSYMTPEYVNPTQKHAGINKSVFTTQCNAVTWTGVAWILGGAGTNTLGYAIMPNASISNTPVLVGLGASIFTTSCTALCTVNNNLIIGGGSGTNSLAYSTNGGQSWTGQGTAIFSTACYALCNGRLLVVAGGAGTNTMAYTNAPATPSWTAVSVQPFSTQCNAIAHNGLLWVAGGSGTNNLAYSYDGQTWTGLGAVILAGGCNAVAWNGQIWVAGGTDSSSNSRNWYSYNGLDWFPAPLAGTGLSAMTAVYGYCSYFRNPSSVIVQPSRLIDRPTDNFMLMGVTTAGSSFAPRLLYTYDGGNTWIQSAQGANSFSFQSAFYSLVYNGQIWVAGVSSAAPGATWPVNYPMGYSYDGINWFGTGNSVFTTGSTTFCVAWNGSYWLAVSDTTPYLAYSTDGVTWIPNSAAGVISNTVAWNGSYWLAGGATSNTQLALS
jgi:hypothetical protein